MRPLEFLSFALATALASGCGGAAPQAPSSMAPAEPGYAQPQAPATDIGSGDQAEESIEDVDQALVALERAESRLAGALGDQASGAGASLEMSTPPDRCEVACEALTSMLNATERLCALSGADDSRCDNAQQRLQSATDRVQTECPACPR